MAIPKETRQKVYDKYDGHCAYCGTKIDYKNMQVDHIIPQREFANHITRGFRIPAFLKHLTDLDVNHIDNLNPACRVCNNWKSAHDLELFRKELYEQIKRLNAYSSNYRIAKKYGLLEESLKPIVFYFEDIIKIKQS